MDKYKVLIYVILGKVHCGVENVTLSTPTVECVQLLGM